MHLFNDISTLDATFATVLLAAAAIFAASLINSCVKTKLDWSVYFVAAVSLVRHQFKPSHLIVIHLGVLALCLIMGMTFSSVLWLVSLIGDLIITYIALYNPAKICDKVFARAIRKEGHGVVQHFYKA